MLHLPHLRMSILLIAGIASSSVIAQEKQPAHHRDGLPTGGSSPEAAACDMIRALANRSYQRFTESTPIVDSSSKTQNDYVNHYVALVTDTTFRYKGGVVTAHDLLSTQRVRLELKRVSSPVAIDRSLINQAHGVLGTSTKHSFVDVTVAERKTGKEATTRMVVMFREKTGQWKAYPIPSPSNNLYKAIDDLESGQIER